MTTTVLPGVGLAAVQATAASQVLRTDVAVLLGRTKLGKVCEPVRVTSWNDAVDKFGAPDGRSQTPYALRGFFENGGQVAWVIRVSGTASSASAAWAPQDAENRVARRQVLASSPGTWANGTRVTIRREAGSVTGPPGFSVRVQAPGEPVEQISAVPPEGLAERLAQSRLVQLDMPKPSNPCNATTDLATILATGRVGARWELVLGSSAGAGRGTDCPPSPADYSAAIEAMVNLPEPALVALPDLDADLPATVGPGPSPWAKTVVELLAAVESQHDRLVVLDTPAVGGNDRAPERADPGRSVYQVLQVLQSLRDLAGRASWDRAPTLLDSLAVYHPRIVVREADAAAGSGGAAVRTVPCAGHVLGVMARLDAERGAHHTPANAVVLDAVDAAEQVSGQHQGELFDSGVNLLRCLPGRGVQVWGGRTMKDGLGPGYVAHRRLVHLLVRSIHRVADPLAFESATAELRLDLVRGVVSVLLGAFRSGALAGSRPAEAFRVTCDGSNNPPDQDPALVVCDVEVAPAVPMEFIRLRLSLGADRGLEVIEA